jgi:hypothetical protein
MRPLTPLEIWNNLLDTKTVPLTGEEFSMGVTQLCELFMVPWLIMDANVHPALFISPEPVLPWSEIEAVSAAHGDGVIVGHEETGGRYKSLRDMEDLAGLLGSLPDGTRLELLTSSDEDAGKQRYTGIVASGQLIIRETAPALSSETLRRAIEFARSKDEKFELGSLEKANQLIQLSAGSLGFLGMEVELEGTSVVGILNGEAGEEAAELLKPLVFQVLFSDGPWEFPPPDQEAQETMDALNSMINAFAGPDPKGERLLYSGDVARYFTARLCSQSHVIPADQERLDDEMRALGFEVLGDLSCNKVMQTVLRGYSGPEGDWAVGTAHAAMAFWYEFYTAFQDGSSITTTTNPMAENRPSKKLFKHTHANLEPPELLKRHRAAVKKHGQKPIASTTKIEDLCKAIDDCLKRENVGF